MAAFQRGSRTSARGSGEASHEGHPHGILKPHKKTRLVLRRTDLGLSPEAPERSQGLAHASVDSAERSASWHLRDFPPGGYQVLIEPYGLEQFLDLTPGQSAMVSFGAESLSYADIHVHGLGEGHDPRFLNVQLRAVGGGDAHNADYYGLVQRAEPGWHLYRVLLPPGQYDLRLSGRGHEGLSDRVSISVGVNTMAYEVTPKVETGISLTMEAGGSSIGAVFAFWTSVQILDATGASAKIGARYQSKGRGMTLQGTYFLTGVGPYTMTFPTPVVGYSLPESIQVDATPGEPIPVVVHLQAE